MFRFQTIHVGIPLLLENCYLLWDDATREALVIDPGENADTIIAAIEKAGVTPKGILLTHAHVDHIRGVSDVSARYGLPVWCHPEDASLYTSPGNALPPALPAAEDLPPLCQEPPRAAGIEYTVIHTPGHSRGSVCYYVPSAGILFSGDTLFRDTHGRTDFAGGSFQQIRASITQKLFTLPDETQVYPGHSSSTTIGHEKQSQFC